MARKRIVLSAADYDRLRLLLNNLKQTNRLHSPHLIQLQEEMEHAIVTDLELIPKKSVTLGSCVSYKNLKDQSTYEATIVFPVDISEEEKRYSILSPIGTALIGEEEGNFTTCFAPAGEIPLQILEVRRPDNRRVDSNAGVVNESSKV